MRDPFGCQDPIAERRYAYARAAARDGDWAVAAEVLEQALELAPHWALAWFAIGEAREKLGDRCGAAEAFGAALELDPSDVLGSRGRRALLGRGSTGEALSPAYLARLFDDFAARFEAHLTRELCYRGPELIAAALDRLDPARRFSRCLDLGCGTGLAGAALRGRVDALIGVDL
jgi:predicted TPR repeat methyltransferase